MLLAFLLTGFSLGCLFPSFLGSPLLGNSLALPLTLGFVFLVAAMADLAAVSVLCLGAQALVAQLFEDSLALAAGSGGSAQHTLHHFTLLQCLQLASPLL